MQFAIRQTEWSYKKRIKIRGCFVGNNPQKEPRIFVTKHEVIKFCEIYVENMTKIAYTMIRLVVRVEWRINKMSEVMGKRVKELRKGKLTQEQLAQYLDCLLYTSPSPRDSA